MRNIASQRGLFCFSRFLPVVVLLLVCSWLHATTNVSGNQGDSIWTLAKSPYNMSGNVTVEVGKTLTIEPGVVVLFPRSANTLTVNGTLNAQGTPLKNIKFVGGDLSYYPLAYNKRGPVIFNSGSVNSILQYVIIDALGYYGYSQESAALMIYSNSCSILNCSIVNTSGSGINIVSATPVISNTTFSNNNIVDVVSTFDHMSVLGNSIDLKIGLVAGTMEKNDTLPRHTYTMFDDIVVASGKTLTINPSVVINFPRDHSQLTIQGTLKAEGTEANNIKFVGGPMGYIPLAYNKRGPIYFDAISINSTLKYVTIDELGYYNYADTIGAIIIRSPSCTITNCTVKNNYATGIQIGNVNTIIKGNIFSNNYYYDIFSSPYFGNSISSNTTASIGISSAVVNQNIAWHNPGSGSRYLLIGTITINPSYNLNIAAGTTVDFKNNYGNLVIKGSLTAIGTPTSKIRFVKQAAGTPFGGTLSFDSTSTGSSLAYIDIDRLGSITSPAKSAAIEINTNSINIFNINISNSESNGLVLKKGDLAISQSNFLNNKTGILSVANKPVITQCSFAGNTSFGINNTSATATDTVDARNNWWGSVTGPKTPNDPSGTGDSVSAKVKFIPFNTSVTLSLVPDIGVSSLVTPVSACGLTAIETVKIIVSNYSSITVNNFSVGYQIGNNSPVIETVSSLSIPPGGSASYSFTQKANLSVVNTYSLKCFTSLSADVFKANDTTTATFIKIATLAQPGNLIPLNNATNLTLPVTFSWSAVTNALAYDFYLWKSTDATPTTPLVSGLTQIRFTYNGNLLQYNKTYKWKVVARNNDCSTAISPQTFYTKALPDIVIDSIFTPPTVFSETPITFWWKTKNKGTANTNANWTETYYWTSSQIILNNSFNEETGTHLIGTVNNVTALNAGQSYRSADFNFTIPVGAQGTYYILVKTNSANSLQEDSTANNITISKPITVTLSPSPDLQVTSLITTPASSIFADSTMLVTYTVKNTDSGRTSNASWVDKIYFSNSPVFDGSNATLRATRNHQGILQQNESYTVNSVPVHIPSHIYGSYYIHVVTDANDQVFENTSNGNNIKTSNPITVFLNPAPNLVVTKVGIPADTVTNRQPITIQWTELNTGAIPTYANWTTRFYLSTDTVLNFQSDIPLGSYNYTTVLNSLDSVSKVFNTEVPAGLPEGKYYCFAYTDATDAIFEATDATHSGENDNAQRSFGQLTVINPDLKPDKPVAVDTAFSEQTIAIGLPVNNNSRANIFNASWKDKVYISTDSLFSSNDTLLTTLPNTTFVVANGSYSRQQDIIIPRGMSGKHYLVVVADADSELTEKTETNNIASQSIFIKLSPYADLQVVSPSPARVVNDTAGTGFAATYSVSNRGKKPITNGEWDDYLFLSPTKNGTETNLVFIGSVHQQRTLDTAATYTQQASFTLSPSLLAGRYYLLVATDYNNAIYENVAEANNKGFGDTINIAPLPFVDLAVDSATISQTSITAGSPLSIRYKVSNPGNTPLLVPSWQDAVYLSNNTVLDASDRLLSEWTITRTMNPGDAYTYTRQITIPSDVSGPLYLLLVTDKNNSVNDITRNNNTKRVAFSVNGIPQDTVIITVVQPPPADLVIDSLIAPAEGTESQPTTMRFTVSNKGPGTTQSRHWIDKLYLSTDFSLSADDIMIGSASHNDSLAAGRSYTDTVQVILPRNITGNYIVIAKADANNNVYERGRKDNNAGFAGILIKAQDSCDLITTNIIVPADTAIAGKPVTIQWKIKNIGSNAANGYTKEGAYISTDSIWDSGDVLLGYTEGTINLAPSWDTTRSLTATIVNTPPGKYYILVRTDVLDNLKEQNENNNTGSCSSPFNIKIKTLPFYVSTADTLQDGVPLYYQLSIPAAYVGETAQLTLTGDSLHNAINRIYLGRDTLPNQNQYSFAGQEPFKANQQILVPALQSGTYYITAYGSSNTAAGRQPVTLQAKTIPFSILSVQTNHGGNTGYVTVKLTGAKFEPGMSIKLSGTTDIFGQNILFVNPTTAFATFNLNGKPLGLYTVNATNAANQTAQITNGFTIEPASQGGTGLNGNGFTCSILNIGYENNLNIRESHPPYTGNHTIAIITVYFKNEGNVDIPLQQRTITSDKAPISLTNFTGTDIQTDTTSKVTTLLLDFKEQYGPPDVFRAGAEGYVKVYVNAYGPPHTKLYFYLKEH